MADSKISGLDALAASPASGDLFVIVDVSDTTMAASGTDKRLAASYLLNAAGTSTGATSQAQTFTNGIIANVAPSTTNTFLIGGRFDPTATSGSHTSGSFQLVAAPTGSTSASYRTLTFDIGSATGNVNNFTATLGMVAVQGNITHRGSGAVTGTCSYYVANPTISGGGSITTAYGIYAAALTAAATNYAIYTNAGLVRLGDQVQMAASTTARASQRIASGVRPTTPDTGDIWDDGALVSYQVSAATNAIVNSFKLERGSSGTAAAGFGLGIAAQLQSSTTATQDAGRLTWEWATATHASRAAAGKLTAYYTSTERTAITWTANSSNVTIDMNANDITNVAAIASQTQTIAPPAGGAGIILTTPTNQGETMLLVTDADCGSGSGPHINIGRNSNASTPAAGYFYMLNQSGAGYAMWVDSGGNLRIGGALPTYANDASGAVVGNQSSSLASKNVLGEFTDYAAALHAILDAPLYDFTYKSGSYGGEQFTGIITDHAPVFGMDNNKSLNEITAHGYSMAAIKELNRKIEALQAIVAGLTQSN